MMNSVSNLIEIHDNQYFNSINTYFNTIRNVKTRVEYEREIRNFFQKVRNRALEFITLDDLQSINKEVIEQYRLYLQNVEKKGSSAIQKFTSALKMLYNYLASVEIPVKTVAFTSLSKIDNDTIEYEAFNYEQVEVAINTVKPTEKGDMKVALILTACYTSFRKNELLSLKYSGLKEIDGVWTIGFPKKVGKRNTENRMPIPDELYEQIMALKAIYGGPDDLIFKIQPKTIQKMMDRIRAALGIKNSEGEGRYVFHSFKKFGVTEVAIITNGDVIKIQRQGNHKDPRTAINTYAKIKDKYSDYPNLQIGKKTDVVSQLKGLGEDKILEILEKCSRSVHLEIQKHL
ncbi:integrase [Paenibacillus sp. LBL]|uniref:tyrosine-type recombinase/integrase n=1 Tax=Paenibacillus sp. LBL TaxID=2940563 RepID=UPI002473AF2B|nr:site-specific integrase [Paenibacillus sp. LBL]MDH6674411.1 integrase [Paenibacillus sp. LBL]